LFVAIGYGSSVAATSPDGITWTQRTLPTNVYWFSITYGNGLFVAVANGSAIAATASLAINSNGTAIGAVQIYDSIVFGSTLVVAGANGSYASWDGSNWKNYDGSGTGTGVYGNGNVVGTNAITSLAIYAGVIMLGAVGGYAAFISSTNQTSKFYNASGTLLDNLLTG
jgi:hypothetical protein